MYEIICIAVIGDVHTTISAAAYHRILLFSSTFFAFFFFAFSFLPRRTDSVGVVNFPSPRLGQNGYRPPLTTFHPAYSTTEHVHTHTHASRPLSFVYYYEICCRRRNENIKRWWRFFPLSSRLLDFVTRTVFIIYVFLLPFLYVTSFMDGRDAETRSKYKFAWLR